MDSLVADPVLPRFMSCTVPRECKGVANVPEEQYLHIPPPSFSSNEENIIHEKVDDVRRKRQRIDKKVLQTEKVTHMSPFVSHGSTPRKGVFVSHDTKYD